MLKTPSPSSRRKVAGCSPSSPPWGVPADLLQHQLDPCTRLLTSSSSCSAKDFARETISLLQLLLQANNTFFRRMAISYLLNQSKLDLNMLFQGMMPTTASWLPTKKKEKKEKEKLDLSFAAVQCSLHERFPRALDDDPRRVSLLPWQCCLWIAPWQQQWTLLQEMMLLMMMRSREKTRNLFCPPLPPPPRSCSDFLCLQTRDTQLWRKPPAPRRLLASSSAQQDPVGYNCLLLQHSSPSLCANHSSARPHYHRYFPMVLHNLRKKKKKHFIPFATSRRRKTLRRSCPSLVNVFFLWLSFCCQNSLEFWHAPFPPLRYRAFSRESVEICRYRERRLSPRRLFSIVAVAKLEEAAANWKAFFLEATPQQRGGPLLLLLNTFAMEHGKRRRNGNKNTKSLLLRYLRDAAAQTTLPSRAWKRMEEQRPRRRTPPPRLYQKSPFRTIHFTRHWRNYLHSTEKGNGCNREELLRLLLLSIAKNRSSSSHAGSSEKETAETVEKK